MVPSLPEDAAPVPSSGLGHTFGHVSMGPKEVLGTFAHSTQEPDIGRKESLGPG